MLWNLDYIMKSGWNCEIWSKVWYLAFIVKLVRIVKFADIIIFLWYCDIWLSLWYLADIVIFGLYCDIWLILWYLAYIVIFGWYCESWTILEQKHLGTSRNIWDHLGTFGNMWGKGAICRALSEFWGKGGLYLWHRRGLSDRLLNLLPTRASLYERC